MTIGPPIPEIQFDLENSRLKAKVKGTVVSVASTWLITFSFYINCTNHSHDMANKMLDWGNGFKIVRKKTDGCRKNFPYVNHVWFEEITFRGFPDKLKKFWQNGGGGGDGENGRETNPPVTWGEFMINGEERWFSVASRLHMRTTQTVTMTLTADGSWWTHWAINVTDSWIPFQWMRELFQYIPQKANWISLTENDLWQ